MMNGASNEILKAEFEKGKTVQIADIQISEIEEEEVHKTSFSGLIRKSVTTPKYYKTIRYYATDGNVYVQKDEYDLVPATATTPASHIPKTNMLGTQIRGKITLEHAFDNHRCRFLRVE